MASFILLIDKSFGKQIGVVDNLPPEELFEDFSVVFQGNGISIAMEQGDTVDPASNGREDFCVDEKSGKLIVSDARIDYRHELAGALGLREAQVETVPDSRLILQAYLKWGSECLSRIYGDFSFAIWEPKRKVLFCARDHFGCRALYYMDQPGFLAVATRLAGLKHMPGTRFKIREQYILDALCSIVTHDNLSPFHGIYKLKPAHYLRQESGQLSTQLRYWDLKINPAFGGLTLQEAADGLRERMTEAVRQRIQRPASLGVELSGGLDSSGIASVLTNILGSDVPIHAYTHTMDPVDPEDHIPHHGELNFSSILVQHYNTLKQHYISGEGSGGGYEVLTRALQHLYKPINLHYAVNADLLFKTAAREGTAIVFSGLGGDEGITNMGNGYFYELIRQGRHAKVRRCVKAIAHQRKRRYYRKLIKLYLNHYAPWILNLYRKDWRRSWYRSAALHQELARKYGMKNRFFETNVLPQNHDVRSLQYFRIMYPNIPERIEETALLAGKHGVFYRYPFLDVKLIEYFYSLPSEFKYKEGMGRYLFRLAMKGILPEEIRMRTDKGGITIPNVYDRVKRDEDKFRALISESREKNQEHYVDYDKLDALLDAIHSCRDLKEQDFSLRAFQSAMSVLILQLWQREGKIDIGIRC